MTAKTTILLLAACLLAAGCAFLPVNETAAGDIGTATPPGSATITSKPDWLVETEELQSQFFSDENREFREALCADTKTGNGGLADYLCGDAAQPASQAVAWTEKEEAVLELSLVLAELSLCVVRDVFGGNFSLEANARECLPQFSLGELAETEILRMYRETDECNTGYSGSEIDSQAAIDWGVDCGQAAGERMAARLGWEGLAAVVTPAIRQPEEEPAAATTTTALIVPKGIMEAKLTRRIEDSGLPLVCQQDVRWSDGGVRESCGYDWRKELSDTPDYDRIGGTVLAPYGNNFWMSGWCYETENVDCRPECEGLAPARYVFGDGYCNHLWYLLDLDEYWSNNPHNHTTEALFSVLTRAGFREVNAGKRAEYYASEFVKQASSNSVYYGITLLKAESELDNYCRRLLFGNVTSLDPYSYGDCMDAMPE